MKVILQQDVKGTGKKGEVIEVSEGYGRNFLLPKKLAVLANAQNVNLAKQKAGSQAHKKAQEADEAKLLASQLAKAEVTGVGDYEAVIKLHPEASAKVLVHVTEG